MCADSMMIRAFMQRLVAKAGGVDATAALIGAATGADVSKGSVSKRLSGQLEWPLTEILALQRAVGDFCVTDWAHEQKPEVQERESLMASVARAHKEQGEALSAAMDVAMGKGSVPAARREVREALDALREIDASLDDHG